MQHWEKLEPADEKLLRKRLRARVNSLNHDEARVSLELLDHLVVSFDPDIVQDFMQWRREPRLTSLLQIAARFDDDTLDQVLFYAEDLFASSKKSVDIE